MLEEIRVPDIGENVVSGKVVAILIRVGEAIEVDDPVIELETDKALVEIPSPVQGSVKELLVREGDEIKVGEVIAKVEIRERKSGPIENVYQAKETGQVDVVEQKKPPEGVSASGIVVSAVSRSESGSTLQAEMVPGGDIPVQKISVDAGKRPKRPLVAASPSIRRLARELGVDIYALEGSGPGGRITEADIKFYVKRKMAETARAKEPEIWGTPPLPDFSRWGEVETVDLATVRYLTAQSTAASWAVIPHVTQFDNADITGLDGFIQTNQDKVAREGAKLTLTAVVVRVCAEALKKYPHFNASIDLNRKQLILKKYIHISMAVDTPRGLLMPVIRNADTKSITQLALDIADLADRARNKKISAQELEGGTFSISNQGGIGGVAFTPIVLWPQAAILGISRSSIQSAYVSGQLQPRNMLPLSLSYDHRIIDGADAARFLRWICDSLAQPFMLFLD